MARKQAPVLEELPPFVALREKLGRPLHVGILSDFTRVSYANGAVFQTRFLYQELQRCGHRVTLIGPHDPDAKPDEIPPGTISLPSLPLHTYPGVYLALPLESWVADPSGFDFDIIFAQSTSLMPQFAVWLRKMRNIPVLCVNTTHLTAAYDVLLPEKLSKVGAVHKAVDMFVKKPFEDLYASIYNAGDGLVVLSEGLKEYWQQRGVKVPIHVIGRAILTDIFDRPLGEDPYVQWLGDKQAGPRFLCAGRHTREKAQDRLIRIFAKHILPRMPTATLSMVGIGPDTEYYKRVASELGVADSVIFTGEVSLKSMPDYYAYADVFLHASLSETFGNVMGEALYCGTPTVAFEDGMGVSAQLTDGVNGLLLDPSTSDPEKGDREFAAAALRLIEDPSFRAKLGKAASRIARERSSPRAVQQKMADAFLSAIESARSDKRPPMVQRSRLRRLRATYQHFKPWTVNTLAVWAFGCLRPANFDGRKGLQPKFEK